MPRRRGGDRAARVEDSEAAGGRRRGGGCACKANLGDVAEKKATDASLAQEIVDLGQKVLRDRPVAPGDGDQAVCGVPRGNLGKSEGGVGNTTDDRGLERRAGGEPPWRVRR